MQYIGIDIGSKGALCWLHKDEELLFRDFDLRAYIALLQEVKGPVIVAIEKVHAMPKQGVKSMFSFGQRLGEIEGVLLTLSIPYELVRPREWQKTLSMPTKTTKKSIADTLLKRYPNAELFSPRGALKDGRSDALGLAHYAKVKYGE